MKPKLTAEECYSIYHDAKMFAQKGIHPKAIKNWEPIIARPTWIYFEKLADMLHRSGGRLDPEEYITAIVNHFPKSVQPKLLITQKGIKAYKNSIKREQLEGSDEHKIGIIKNSILFVVKYCLQHNIKNFADYFHDKSAVYPTMAMHLDSGRLSPYFVYLIPDILDKVYSYPTDVRVDIFGDKFTEKCSTFNIATNNSSELRTLRDNLEQIVNKLIKNKEK